MEFLKSPFFPRSSQKPIQPRLRWQGARTTTEATLPDSGDRHYRKRQGKHLRLRSAQAKETPSAISHQAAFELKRSRTAVESFAEERPSSGCRCESPR